MASSPFPRVNTRAWDKRYNISTGPASGQGRYRDGPRAAGPEDEGDDVPTVRSTPSREKPEQIADELRALIVGGQLEEGESLGREPDLVERFGVSRPSLREALRILEAEGLITVVRGALGGVVVHEPNERMTARTAALVLQARNVPLADVYDARSVLEPAAAATVARSSRRRSAGKELLGLIDLQEASIDDPDAFGDTNARFHERLVAL